MWYSIALTVEVQTDVSPQKAAQFLPLDVFAMPYSSAQGWRQFSPSRSPTYIYGTTKSQKYSRKGLSYIYIYDCYCCCSFGINLQAYAVSSLCSYTKRLILLAFTYEPTRLYENHLTLFSSAHDQIIKVCLLILASLLVTSFSSVDLRGSAAEEETMLWGNSTTYFS